jgi:mycothiol synthase
VHQNIIIDQRSFSDEQDKVQMSALARRFPADNLHRIDLPYRLSSWAFDDPQNIRLWFDDHRQIIAWAALQTPFWTIDYVIHPDAEVKLHPQILAWADRRARTILETVFGHPAWFIMAFSEQIDRIRDLEQAGFKCQAEVGADSWSKVLMRHPAQTPVKLFKPPAGFIVRPLAGKREVKEYVDLHQSVFESKNMSMDWRLRTLRHSDYRPDLDIVVEAPDGRLAAFCVCWIDGDSLEGQVEPLGCHKDFRRYALGRVALSEGLYRLQYLGARQIFVETDSYRDTAFRLYESFDFHVIRNVLIFRKDFVDVHN